MGRDGSSSAAADFGLCHPVDERQNRWNVSPCHNIWIYGLP